MNPRQQLEASLRSGRLTHAFLLVGQHPEREAVVEQIAQAYLCLRQEREDSATPCGSCLSCRLARAGAHADLRRWEPERGSWRIEQVRALIQEAWRQPSLGSRRVHILADVHALTLPSANALLKLLEEPPVGSLFLLLTDAIAGLPTTLVSRCQVASWAATPRPVAATVAATSRPVGAERLLWAVGEGVTRGKGSHLLTLARELAEAGEDMVLSLCRRWREALVRAIAGAPAADLDGWPPATWPPSALLRAWEASERLGRRLQVPVNARLSWEWFLLEVAEIGVTVGRNERFAVERTGACL